MKRDEDVAGWKLIHIQSCTHMARSDNMKLDPHLSWYTGSLQMIFSLKPVYHKKADRTGTYTISKQKVSTEVNVTATLATSYTVLCQYNGNSSTESTPCFMGSWIHICNHSAHNERFWINNSFSTNGVNFTFVKSVIFYNKHLKVQISFAITHAVCLKIEVRTFKALL
jgi:hypothetical protein